MQKSVFVIHTPYQLLSALNIIEHYNEKNVSMIFVHHNMEKYKALCKQAGIADVIFAKELYDGTAKFNIALMYIILFFRILKKKAVTKKLLKEWDKYDILYVPSDDLSCRVIYHYLLKKNIKLKLCLIDDGTGTYYGIVFRKKALISKIIFTLLLDKNFYEKLDTIYCYHPELINANRNIKKNKINFSNNIVANMGRLYHDSIDRYIGYKVIFLDQGINEFDKIRNCLNILLNYFDKNEVVVKKHPRVKYTSDPYEGFNVLDDGLPFEVIIATLDCSKCLLVSFTSSAAINPYLIFNEQPFVILINKLSDNNYRFTNNIKLNNKNMLQIEQLFYMINSKIGYEYIYEPIIMSQYIAYLKKIKNSVNSISYRKL